jgi:hypothetical protein
MRALQLLISSTLGTLLSLSGQAQTTAELPKIHMVYMGGNDCPPCVAWRAFELPKLKTTDAFKSIQFSHVDKTIRSAAPPAFWLPEEVKPYKDKLDVAGNRRGGSAQTAILVNGEVYDYYWGTRTAEQIEKMIVSIQSKTKYPFTPCARIKAGYTCEKTSPQPDAS